MGLIGFGPAWDLGRAIAGASRKATRDRYATVTRRDPDGVTWGTIAGASGEVPLGGSLADAEVGDVVAVDWRGGVPVASGNATSPAVGARQVEGAVAPVRAASAAAHGAARAAQSVADAAKSVAEAVNQHFFADTSGIHVTAATQDEWDTSHSGANVLLNSAGQLFRDGLNNLLTLTTEGGARALTVWDGLGNAAGNVRAVIGETITLGNAADGSVVTIDSDSMDMMHGTDEMLHFGYGEGAAASGTANAPYYTIGTRAANSTVGNYSVAEGYGTTASGYASHAEGRETTASSYQSHAEGVYTEASGAASHAEGMYTEASGVGSHAEGSSTQGYKIVASYFGSHAEGDATYGDVTASARAAHAEGSATTASGVASHAEGAQTTASGANSHAEGQATTASGINSHAGGFKTIAASYNQTALGRYNVADANSTYAVIVGNGTSASARSNALTVGWDGSVNTRSASHAGTERPTSNTALQKIDSYDSEGASVGYAQIVLTSGGVYRSYAVRNPTTGETVALYLQALDNGTKQLTLSSGATIADSAIPTLAIDTKTSGTLAKDRGGTGVTGKQSSTITLTGLNSASVNYCWHNGVVATVSLGVAKLKSSLASGSNVAIGTVPSGYRPANNVYFPVSSSTESVSSGLFVIIASSGVITLYNLSGSSASTSVNFYMTATYAI